MVVNLFSIHLNSKKEELIPLALLIMPLLLDLTKLVKKICRRFFFALENGINVPVGLSMHGETFSKINKRAPCKIEL